MSGSVYESFSDEELIDMLRDGDEKVSDYLMNKYKNMVKSKAGKMFLIGGDTEDLIQEGMIGLFRAVKDFDPGRDATFCTFADLCITRQMYTAITAAGRQKHGPLNSYISIYAEDFQSEGGIDPEEEFLNKERMLLLEDTFEKELTPLEKQVLDLKRVGMDYREIAAVLGREAKSVDNTLQRIKAKIKKIVKTS